MRFPLEAETSAPEGWCPAVIVRPYDGRDRAAVRDLCRQAARGQPDPLFHEDGELAPLLFADYYLDREPDCCFVAEVDGRIVGYIVGTRNTRACRRALGRRIIPRVVLRIATRIVTLRYRRKVTYRAAWAYLLARLRPGPADCPESLLGRYPGHSHLNVAAGYRGQGLGFALSTAFHDHLRACGITGMHAVVLEPAGDDSMSRYLCARRGHEVVAARLHGPLRTLTGRDYYLKLLVCDLEREARELRA